MFQRVLPLPRPPTESFFLWGPRQVGKSTLLRHVYPEALRVDLLRSDEFARYVAEPHRLREEIEASKQPRVVVIDEVQEIPALLDEVHWLIENRGTVFALCGSSARKVRRGHANLLGGRALRHELLGLVSAEIGADFDLARALNQGYLPRHYLATNPRPMMRAYLGDYLKEEVAAEGLTRNLPSFARFLDAAALSDCELVNFSTIARDSGVSSHTVQSWFEVLVDTLLGRFLPAFVRRPKRRVIAAPKFYFADVGVVNQLARRGQIQPGSELWGKAFENWVHHEIRAHSEYSGEHYELAYWRLASGIEVDFVLGDMEVAVEAKGSARIDSDDLKGLRALAVDHPGVRRRVVVSLEPRARKTEDGIEILPARDFARRLWGGEIGPEASR
jgi:predicted AAA+ superfamily ATPase